MSHFFYADGSVWHGFRYWKTGELVRGEVVGWNTCYLPYTIRKITTKQITVERKDVVGKTVRIVLNRQTMERDGKQCHTRFHEYFYAEKPRPGTKDWNWEGSNPNFSIPLFRGDYLTVLGLSVPFTEKDVRRAYKRLALKTHPDLGGDAAEFIKVKQAHDSAMRFASVGI